MLQQANKKTSHISVPSAQEHISKITPSLAALDDAQALMRREWRRDEPSEDVHRQYSTLFGHLTPTQPRHEDMRMDSTLNVTPGGSLSKLPATTGGNADLRKEQWVPQAPEIEIRGTLPSTAVLGQTEETPYTSVKVIPEQTSDGQRAGQVDIPRRILRTREVSQVEALASVRHFFASENGQNQALMSGLPEEVPTTTTGGTTLETSIPAITPTVPTTSTATTTTGAEVGSPRSFLSNGSPSRPTVTATCRPQTWVQRISEGWTHVPPPDGTDSAESTLPEPSLLVEE